jgi:hypothetical protein
VGCYCSSKTKRDPPKYSNNGAQKTQKGILINLKILTHKQGQGDGVLRTHPPSSLAHKEKTITRGRNKIMIISPLTPALLM